MPQSKSPTVHRLKELLNYNPETGVFVSRVNRGPFSVGDVVGNVDSMGYIQMQIDGRMYRGHVLAWTFMTGAPPTHQIDHANENRKDNSWKNLRKTTQSHNQLNVSAPRKDSKHRYKGVKPYKDKFSARIQVNGVRKDLGLFDTQEEARDAYLKEKNKYV